MKTHIISIVKVLFLTVVLGACDTDEEVYQVTDRADAYISSVQLYTADNRNVATQVNIDDANGIINVEVKNGVNRAHLNCRSTLQISFQHIKRALSELLLKWEYGLTSAYR